MTERNRKDRYKKTFNSVTENEKKDDKILDELEGDSQLTVMIPKSLHHRLKRIAVERHKKIKELIVEFIEGLE